MEFKEWIQENIDYDEALSFVLLSPQDRSMKIDEWIERHEEQEQQDEQEAEDIRRDENFQYESGQGGS